MENKLDFMFSLFYIVRYETQTRHPESRSWSPPAPEPDPATASRPDRRDPANHPLH